MENVNFTSLIAPLSVNDFFQNYWEKEFLHLSNNQPNYFEKILSHNDLGDFFSQQNLIPDGIRLMNKGNEIPAREWIKQETLLDGTVKTTANPEKIFKLFYNGATIILNSAEKSIPRLANACRIFEQELKIKVQSNIYITPPNSQGFALHYDPHDIFLMQIKGPKTWQIYDSGEELPTTYRAFRKKPVLVSKIEINSGDFVYMPRGTGHEAFSSDVSTIHANFSCKPRYGFHLVEGLAKLAEQDDVFFRRTIPTGLADPNDIQEYATQFKSKLLGLIEKTPPEKLLAMQLEHFVSNQLMDFENRLANSLKLEQLNLDTSVSRKKGFTYLISKNDSELKVSFGERNLKIPNFIETDIFFQDVPFKIREIKGLLTNNGRLDIARELLEAGFLQFEYTD